MRAFPDTGNLLMPRVSMGTSDIMAGYAPGLATLGTGSAAWPTANLALFVPFRLAAPVVVAKLWVSNGATVSGNIDVGIYDAAGTKIVSAGSTAQAGTSAPQAFDIADTIIGPGLFYMACALDNTTGTTIRFLLSSSPVGRVAGLAQQESAFALPAAATFASWAQTHLPNIGFMTRAAIL